MNKKTVIQIFLIFLIFLISISFYLKYFKNSSKILGSSLPVEKGSINQNNMSTFIDNINYVSSDSSENRYQITADQAEIKIQNADLMFLTNVVAYVFIENSDTVKITSDFGEYNSKNYDTIFSKNVIVVYPGHKITGEYLDFSFLSNLGTISTNVIYKGDKTNLFADRIEIDLISKDTKVFMNNSTKKVLIEGTR